MPDITRLHKNAEKKVVSVACAKILHGDVAATTSQELFILPANCLIINSGVVVEVAGQANLTVDFGFNGGNELGNDLDIDGTGYVQVPLSLATLTLTEGTPNTLSASTITPAPRILTGTGKTVTAKFSADPSAGVFYFIVEYIEYRRTNGELMNFGSAG